MKIEKIVLILITPVILTVGCATVKEKEEEKEEIIGRFFETKWTTQNGDTFTVFKKIDEYGNVTIRATAADTNDSVYRENERKREELFNKDCKTYVSVFPNPTSSSATININKKVDCRNFKYKLIFDEKIIYEDNILTELNLEKQIVIPAHLIQKEGTYIVAYEIWITENHVLCKNTVPFMVIKK